MARSSYVQRRLAEIRTESRPLTTSQRDALEWLRLDPKREIYEGADRLDTKRGCGQYWITFSNGQAPVLSREEVFDLSRRGLIERRWKDCECYRLSSTVSAAPEAK